MTSDAEVRDCRVHHGAAHRRPARGRRADADARRRRHRPPRRRGALPDHDQHGAGARQPRAPAQRRDALVIGSTQRHRRASRSTARAACSTARRSVLTGASRRASGGDAHRRAGDDPPGWLSRRSTSTAAAPCSPRERRRADRHHAGHRDAGAGRLVLPARARRRDAAPGALSTSATPARRLPVAVGCTTSDADVRDCRIHHGAHRRPARRRRPHAGARQRHDRPQRRRRALPDDDQHGAGRSPALTLADNGRDVLVMPGGTVDRAVTPRRQRRHHRRQARRAHRQPHRRRDRWR